MRYLFLVVERYKGKQLLADILPKFEYALQSLYQAVPGSMGNVTVYCFQPTNDLMDLAGENRVSIRQVFQPDEYPEDYMSETPILDILTAKIVLLRDHSLKEECVLIDLDTKVLSDFSDILGSKAVLAIREYPLLSERELDHVLPYMPLDLGVHWDSGCFMYNSGFVFIPSSVRRQVCEKALRIVRWMNDRFSRRDRYGNKLDEQIALSIAIQSEFRPEDILTVEGKYLKHFWQESMSGRKWWGK